MTGVPVKSFRLMVVGALLLLPVIGDGQISDPYADAVRYFDLGRFERAAARLQTILRTDPECVECYDLLARIATAEGADSLAAVWYRWAVEVEPENATLLQKLGIAEHRAGEYDHALLDLRQSLDLNPTSGESYFALGNVWLELDSLDLAKWAYHEAIALDSTLARYHFSLGTAYSKTEQPDSALAAFQQAYRWYPKSTQAYEEAARILIDQERWEEVVTVLETGLKSAPETRNTRYWLGAAYVEVGNFQRAAAILKGFVVRRPDHIGAQYNFGIALYEINEYNEAVTHLTAVKAQRPDLIKAQLYLGRALGKLDQDSLAFAVFDSLLHKEPDYYEAWIDRGDIHLKRARYSEATEQYQEASAVDSWQWEAYHRQALTEYDQGHYAAAEQLLFTAFIRNDSAAVIYDALGDVASAVSEDDFAIYYYNMVLRLEPANDMVRSKLVEALIRRRLWVFAKAQLLWFYGRDPANETVISRLALGSQADGGSLAAQDYYNQFSERHNLRRERERLELRARKDSRNPRRYRELGMHYRHQGDDAQARDYFRKAVALGDTTLSVSDYLEEGEGP